MGANKLEAFTIEVVNRRDIHGADYNPRKIGDTAKKKIRKFLKDNGLWSPLVLNKRTGTLVSGHQRLAAMDALIGKDDYDLTMSIVDVDEKTEISGNVFMNNQSAMGEWDIDLLAGLKDLLPDIDYVDDFGFDESDIDVLFGEDFLKKTASDLEESYDEFAADPVKEAKAAARRNMTAVDYRAMKKGMREKAKAENEQDGSYNLEQADYTLTVVFPNNREKQDFMRKIHQKPTEKYIKSTVFHDIANGVYDISVLG